MKKSDDERPAPPDLTEPRGTRAPWQPVHEGVERLKVPGGYLYRVDGQLAFVPGA
jgi:hypothetical protein